MDVDNTYTTEEVIEQREELDHFISNMDDKDWLDVNTILEETRDLLKKIELDLKNYR